MAILALAIPVVLSSSCTSVPAACPGQCGPPFQLEVGFHKGTSPEAKQAIAEGCAKKPGVISIGQINRTGAFRGEIVVYTKTIGRPSNEALFACLQRSASYGLATWPV